MSDIIDTSRFTFTKTPLAGLCQVDRKPIADHRGFFQRFYCTEEFAAAGFTKPTLQMNHSLSRQKGTIRGLHFQNAPYAETKIITCMRGAILDVAVDMRRSSPTFLKWFAVELTAENHRSLIVPEGFAHGFQSLTDDCEILYLVTAPYNGASEGGLNPFDPSIGVEWPVAVTDISERDANRAHIDPETHPGVTL